MTVSFTILKHSVGTYVFELFHTELVQLDASALAESGFRQTCLSLLKAKHAGEDSRYL